MSLMKVNKRHLNQLHLLKQAISICAAGQCSEQDILHRLLLLMDLFDVNLDIVKCEERSNYDLSNPVIWVLMLALGIVLSRAIGSFARQCKRLFARRSPGKIKWCLRRSCKFIGSSISIYKFAEDLKLCSFIPAGHHTIFCTNSELNKYRCVKNKKNILNYYIFVCFI